MMEESQTQTKKALVELKHLGPNLVKERDIYIYAGELLVCPPFGLSRDIRLATSIKIGFEDFVMNFGPN